MVSTRTTLAPDSTFAGTSWQCFALRKGEQTAIEIRRDEATRYLSEGARIWLDVVAPEESDAKWLSSTFGFHELALIDLRSNDVRPKQEAYGDVLFTVFGAINLNPGEDELDMINLNIFLTDRFVVSAHRKPLKTIRNAITLMSRKPSPLARGTDYLYYLLLDGVVNRYLDIMDDVETQLDEIETIVFADRPRPVQEQIFTEKRRLALLRRSVGAKRDALRELVYGNLPQISPETRTLLRDVLDQVMRISDSIESYRELASGLMDSYMSHISHRMNEVMKLMSVIATMMLPLSFLTGIFGMNFDVMPGTHVSYGFWVLAAFMGMMVAGLIWFFRRSGIL